MIKSTTSLLLLTTCLVIHAQTKAITGTNIGGWMVLEPWITPSLFYRFLGKTRSDGIGVDSYTFCEALGPEKGNEVMPGPQLHPMPGPQKSSLPQKKITKSLDILCGFGSCASTGTPGTRRNTSRSCMSEESRWSGCPLATGRSSSTDRTLDAWMVLWTRYSGCWTLAKNIIYPCGWRCMLGGIVLMGLITVAGLRSLVGSMRRIMCTGRRGCPRGSGTGISPRLHMII